MAGARKRLHENGGVSGVGLLVVGCVKALFRQRRSRSRRHPSSRPRRRRPRPRQQPRHHPRRQPPRRRRRRGAGRGLRFQDPVYPGDASKKLVIDAPRASRRRSRTTGKRSRRALTFISGSGPGWESNLGKDDRKSGYGLTDIKWVKAREEGDRLPGEESREGDLARRGSWWTCRRSRRAKAPRPIAARSAQSIVEPETYTKDDVDGDARRVSFVFVAQSSLPLRWAPAAAARARETASAMAETRK